MDVRAIVVVGGADDPNEGRMGGVPLPMLETLGRRIVTRAVERMKRAGVGAVTVVAEDSTHSVFGRRDLPEAHWIDSAAGEVWRQAAHAFTQTANGADAVLLVHLGCWVEIDFEHLLQEHVANGARVSFALDPDGEAAGVAVVAPTRRNDAAHLLKGRFRTAPANAHKYRFRGYVNPLRDAYDLRKLAVDGLIGRCAVAPCGEEIRPGVWVAEGARIQRGARVLAPSFIGSQAKIRASAVVTRGSSVERTACVDVGSVVDNTTVLAGSIVGAGLDVSHAVVGFKRVASLQRGVEVEISDAKLIDSRAPAPVRAMKSAASLAGFVPMEFMRGLFGKRKQVAPLPQAVKTPAAALNENKTEAEGEFPAPMLVARRYGK